MKRTQVTFRLIAVAAAVALAACGHDDSTAPATASEPAPEWSAVALGQVQVEGGLRRLSMPRDGLVQQVLVQVGEHVEQGQLLATLDPESARLALGAAQAALDQANAKVTTLQTRIGDLELRRKRLAAVAAAGAGGQQSADDARAAVNDSRGELVASRADAAAARQKLDEARHELDQQSLHSPVAGEVVTQAIQPGTMATTQSPPAFIVLPDLPRIIHAEVNSTFVPNVQVGMSADVIEDGSGRSFRARVIRLGKVFGANELEEDPQLRANARSIDCILAIDASAPPDLLIGQRVQVRFLAQGKSGD